MHLSCDSVVYLTEIETHISKKTHEVKISVAIPEMARINNLCLMKELLSKRKKK